MSESPIEALDLAALLCSRVCHDLISPVGAIVNGLEVLEEEKDEATKEFALDLIKSSAGTASIRRWPTTSMSTGYDFASARSRRVAIS